MIRYWKSPIQMKVKSTPITTTIAKGEVKRDQLVNLIHETEDTRLPITP